MENEPLHQEHGADDPCGDECRQRHNATNDDFRTHMANERTFLAWCRTSISLVIFGFVAERLHLFMEIPGVQDSFTLKQTAELKIVSLFSFILAGVIILVSGYRFLSVRNTIRLRQISISVFPEILVVLSMVMIIAMVIILLI